MIKISYLIKICIFRVLASLRKKREFYKLALSHHYENLFLCYTQTMTKIIKKILPLSILLLSLCLPAVNAQSERPSVALVLGGGGAKGFAHIAVLELMEELGIPIDMIAGVSSGAIVGGLYSAGYSPQMILEAMEDRDWSAFFQDRQASPFWNSREELPLALGIGNLNSSISSILGRGYSSGQTVYQLFKALTAKIPSYIDFDNLHIPFRAGVVEIPGGKFELLGDGDLAEAIRASMSIQGIFEPFVINGKSYVDGGMIRVLPVREVREMGYDIVIAVDLFVSPQSFDIAPTALPELMNTLYTNQMSKEHHGLANVVLFPIPVEISIMDFGRGHEIYTIAKNELEKLAVLLEPIRAITAQGAAAGGTAANASGSGIYENIPPLVPGTLNVEGALSRDRSFIERMFSRFVRDRALEEKNITVFLEKIYETGNYRMASVRTDLRSGETRMNLILYPQSENKILFRAGFDYEGTFSFDSSTMAALRSGVEFNARNGFSLFFRASVLDELSAGLALFMPLNPHFFLYAQADLVRDQELKTTGIISRDNIVTDRLLYFRGALKGGLRFNKYNSLSILPDFFWFNDGDKTNSMAGISTAYTFSNLDNSFLPSSGFRLRLENCFRFYLNDPEPFDIVGFDLAAAIPLGRYFGIGTSVYGSFLFCKINLPSVISGFDYEKTGRYFFPHISDIFTGEKRAAVSISFKFEPRGNLGLLGGRTVFFLNMAAGRAANDWKEWADFGNGNLIWNASLGAAFTFIENIGVMLRAGAGGGGGSRPAPFISLDVGIKRFQKRLF